MSFLKVTPNPWKLLSENSTPLETPAGLNATFKMKLIQRSVPALPMTPFVSREEEKTPLDEVSRKRNEPPAPVPAAASRASKILPFFAKERPGEVMLTIPPA